MVSLTSVSLSARRSRKNIRHETRSVMRGVVRRIVFQTPNLVVAACEDENEVTSFAVWFRLNFNATSALLRGLQGIFTVKCPNKLVVGCSYAFSETEEFSPFLTRFFPQNALSVFFCADTMSRLFILPLSLHPCAGRAAPSWRGLDSRHHSRGQFPVLARHAPSPSLCV